MHYRRSSYLAIFLLLVSIPAIGRQLQLPPNILVSDFDGTFIQQWDDAESASPAYYLLRRVENSSCSFGPNLNDKEDSFSASVTSGLLCTDQFVLVEWDEYQNIRRSLAKAVAGSFQSFHLGNLMEPIAIRSIASQKLNKILPGLYTADHLDFYKSFHKTNPVDLDQEAKVFLDRVQEKRFKQALKEGSFPLVQKLLNHPQGAEHLSFWTARSHPTESFQAFFARLKDAGLIKNLPNAELLHTFGRDLYRGFSQTPSPNERKVRAFKELLIHQSQILFDENVYPLNQSASDPSKMVPVPSILYYDNDVNETKPQSGTVAQVIRSARKLLSYPELHGRVKVMIGFNARPEAKQAIGFPVDLNIAVLTDEGLFRPATEEEKGLEILTHLERDGKKKKTTKQPAERTKLF